MLWSLISVVGLSLTSEPRALKGRLPSLIASMRPPAASAVISVQRISAGAPFCLGGISVEATLAQRIFAGDWRATPLGAAVLEGILPGTTISLVVISSGTRLPAILPHWVLGQLQRLWIWQLGGAGVLAVRLRS